MTNRAQLVDKLQKNNFINGKNLRLLNLYDFLNGTRNVNKNSRILLVFLMLL